MALSALFLAFFLIISSATDAKEAQVAPDTLRLVHMLFRHGDRTPVRPYPKDPYFDVKFWPVTWGQLTNEGKQRHFKLGQFNRQRYTNFLSEIYNPDEVYIRSTDVDRTLMSAESHLAGLFPPKDNQTWNPDLIWQPIPIHTIPKEQDLLLVLESECPRYDELYSILNNSPEVKKKMDDKKDLLNFLAENSGLNMTDIEDVEYLYDTLFIENRFNKTLPSWTQDVFPDQMKDLSDFSFVMKAYNLQMQRLRGGPLVKEIAEHFKDYTQSKLGSRKLFMYSAHDVTVSMLLSALNIFNNIQPPYASMVLVELHELEPNQLSVQILYKNVSDDGEDPFALTLPGCSAMCPLDDFFNLVKNVTSDDVKVECKLLVPNAFNTFLVIYVLASLSGLLLLVIMAGVITWYRRRRDSGYVYTTIQAE